eukprot:PhF_6_TR10626/c0_g1_i1/m.17210
MLAQPLLQIVNVFEDSFVLRIMHPDTRPGTRSDIWDVRIEAPSFTDSAIVEAAAACVDVPVRVREPHCLVTVNARGRTAGSEFVSDWQKITIPLLPKIVLKQGLILPDRLHIHWSMVLPGQELPAVPMDECVVGIEVDVDGKRTTVTGPTSETCLSGVSILTFDDLTDNSACVVKMRLKMVAGKDGPWSDEIKAYTLPATLVEVSCVGEDVMTVTWGSARQYPNWKDRSLVSEMKLRVWSPNRGGLRTFSVDTREDPSIFPNVTILNGLCPNTVYHAHISWRNSVPTLTPHEQYFRFCTMPRMYVKNVEKMGTEYVDVSFDREEAITLPSVHTVHDDEFNENPRRAEIAGTYRSTKPWIDLANAECWQIPVLYRCRLVRKANADEDPTIVDVDPILDVTLVEQPHKTRIKNLIPGSAYGFSMRCLGMTKAEYKKLKAQEKGSGQGLGTSYWGLWSETVLVCTAHRISLKVEQRGTKKIDLLWSRPKQAILGDTKVPGSTIREAVVGLIQCEPNQSFYDEGDRAWGVTDQSLGNMYFQRFHDADVYGQVSIDNLTPNTSYRISLNTQDDEGTWSGRFSIVVSTLREDLATERHDADALPYIDEGYHLKEQDLPEWNDGVASCKMMYQVHMGENRVKELRVISSGKKSHVGLVALQLDLDQVGEDYAMLSWRVHDVEESVHSPAAFMSSTSYAVDSSLNISTASAGRMRPSTGMSSRSREFNSSFQQTNTSMSRPSTSSLHRPKTAQVLNRDSSITEYKLKVCRVEEWGKSSLLCEIYFRSASRSTRLQGLKSGLNYSIAICRFDPEVQQWVPSWSNQVLVCPARHLVLNIAGMSYRGVLIEWRRTRILRADTPIISYKVTLADETNKTSEDVMLSATTSGPVCTSEGWAESPRSCPSSHYLLAGDTVQGPKLLRVVITPKYKNLSWGCCSNEMVLLIVPIVLRVVSRSQSTISVEWDELSKRFLTPCDENMKSADVRSIVFLSARSSKHHAVDDVLWETTTHTFQNLSQKERYELSATAMRTVCLCTCCQRAPLQTTFAPTTVVVTDGPITLDTFSIGESYITLRWNRLEGPCPSYEIAMTDIETTTQKHTTVIAHGNGLYISKTLTGLHYGKRYLFAVRAATGTLSNTLTVNTLPLINVHLDHIDKDAKTSFVVVWSRAGAHTLGTTQPAACEVAVTEVLRTPFPILATIGPGRGQIDDTRAPQQIGDTRTVRVEAGSPWRLEVGCKPKGMYKVAVRSVELGESWSRWSRPLLVCIK